LWRLPRLRLPLWRLWLRLSLRRGVLLPLLSPVRLPQIPRALPPDQRPGPAPPTLPPPPHITPPDPTRPPWAPPPLPPPPRTRPFDCRTGQGRATGGHHQLAAHSGACCPKIPGSERHPSRRPRQRASSHRIGPDSNATEGPRRCSRPRLQYRIAAQGRANAER